MSRHYNNYFRTRHQTKKIYQIHLIIVRYYTLNRRGIPIIELRKRVRLICPNRTLSTYLKILVDSGKIVRSKWSYLPN